MVEVKDGKKILTTPVSAEDLADIQIGDIIYLNGDMTTCRDVAHRRLVEEGRELPVDVKDAAIFHAGPIIRPLEDDKFEMVSVGPTTSMRMEKFEKEFDNPDFYLENELFRLYENALKQLPKDYREAYEMNRNHRMTHKEIAEKLNVSPQTVNYRIGQALKLLRIALKDYLPLFILYFGLDIFKQS